jgi:hypothetical protein
VKAQALPTAEARRRAEGAIFMVLAVFVRVQFWLGLIYEFVGNGCLSIDNKAFEGLRQHHL